VDLPRDAMLLRVFIGEDAKYQHRPLYEAIVLKAREVQLAGATVLRGPLGFGHSTRLHSTKILDVRENLPLVIEIVDTEDNIKAFFGSRRHDAKRACHAGESPGPAVWRARQARAGLKGLPAAVVIDHRRTQCSFVRTAGPSLSG
jgi:uncharacterized protein